MRARYIQLSRDGDKRYIASRIRRMYLRRPPTIALVASLCMFAVGSAMGGALVRFQDTLYDVAREAIVKRPEVHGFGGVEVIDQQRIAEVVEQSNNALRMLHVHGLGLGMMILLVSIVIVNLPLSERLQQVLCLLVSLGALYPPGWLLLGVLIPYGGVNALRASIEFGLFALFGGTAIVGIWGTLIVQIPPDSYGSRYGGFHVWVQEPPAWTI